VIAPLAAGAAAQCYAAALRCLTGTLLCTVTEKLPGAGQGLARCATCPAGLKAEQRLFVPLRARSTAAFGARTQRAGCLGAGLWKATR